VRQKPAAGPARGQSPSVVDLLVRARASLSWRPQRGDGGRWGARTWDGDGESALCLDAVFLAPRKDHCAAPGSARPCD